MKFYLIIIALFLSGCVNKNGISLKAYPECEENYNSYGVYYYHCKDNILNTNFNPYNMKKNPKICLDCN